MFGYFQIKQSSKLGLHASEPISILSIWSGLSELGITELPV
jgi:hypothetical protein